MLEADRELSLVLNHSYSVDAFGSLTSNSNELNLKFSYIFRY